MLQARGIRGVGLKRREKFIECDNNQCDNKTIYREYILPLTMIQIHLILSKSNETTKSNGISVARVHHFLKKVNVQLSFFGNVIFICFSTR